MYIPLNLLRCASNVLMQCGKQAASCVRAHHALHATMQVSGTVDQSGAMLSDDVAEKGYALLCMAMPQSDCKIVTVNEVSMHWLFDTVNACSCSAISAYISNFHLLLLMCVVYIQYVPCPCASGTNSMLLIFSCCCHPDGCYMHLYYMIVLYNFSAIVSYNLATSARCCTLCTDTICCVSITGPQTHLLHGFVAG